MKDAKLLKVLVEQKALVKVLKTIGAGKGYSTRELLTKLGAYGYGHKSLLQADEFGLVDRKTVKNKVFNSLTSDGEEDSNYRQGNRRLINSPSKY